MIFHVKENTYALQDNEALIERYYFFTSANSDWRVEPFLCAGYL